MVEDNKIDITSDEYWRGFFGTAQSSLMENVIVPIIGNNDIGTSVDDVSNFISHFELCNVCPTCETAYSFDYGNAHFICLDTNRLHAEQKVWFNQDIQNTTKKWKIVLMHIGPYTSKKDETFSFVSLFDSNEIDLVLFGHKHVYMKSHIMKGDYVADTGTVYVMGSPTGDKYNGISVSEQFWMEKLIHPQSPSYNSVSINNNSIVVKCNKVVGETIEELHHFEITK